MTDWAANDDRPRRKRHPIRTTITVIVIIALLGGSTFYVAEFLAKSYAKQIVQAAVAQEFGTSGSDVAVNLGTGFLVPQLVKKHIKTLHITAKGVDSGPLTGTVVIDATQVPLSTSQPMATLAITANIPSSGLAALLDTAQANAADTASIVGGNLRVGKSVTLAHKRKLAITVDYAPTLSGNYLVLTPTSYTLNGKQYSSKQLKASIFARLAKPLLVVRNQCLASALPVGIKPTSVAVADNELVIAAAGTNLSLSSLSTKGACASS